MKIQRRNVEMLLTFAMVALVSCQQAEQHVPAELVDLTTDRGGEPWALNIEEATLQNEDYRVANWTGEFMQLVFMTLQPGEIIDLEKHEGHDQFIRIEKGEAFVQMGLSEDNFTFEKKVSDDWAIMIPAGYWHRVENIGDGTLQLYTLYGPPEHPKGTVSSTYKEAKESHDHQH
jgi:mannose-6-phosphate isomerase-like protein (cupin superfamily)